MSSLLSWATVASPIVGVIAIIVALIIAHRSSKETKQQIEAIYKLLDVFVAAQNPTMIEAKREYELQLAELNKQIKELEDDILIDNFPPPGGPMINVAYVMDDKIHKIEKHEVLESKRKEIEENLKLIQSYLERAQNK